MALLCCVVCGSGLASDDSAPVKEYYHRLQRVLTSDIIDTSDITSFNLCAVCVERLEKIEELLQIQTIFIQDFIANHKRLQPQVADVCESDGPMKIRQNVEDGTYSQEREVPDVDEERMAPQTGKSPPSNSPSRTRRQSKNKTTRQNAETFHTTEMEVSSNCGEKNAGFREVEIVKRQSGRKRKTKNTNGDQVENSKVTNLSRHEAKPTKTGKMINQKRGLTDASKNTSGDHSACEDSISDLHWDDQEDDLHIGNISDENMDIKSKPTMFNIEKDECRVQLPSKNIQKEGEGEEHVPGLSKKEQFKCSYCSKSYQNARNLDLHTKKQHQDKKDTYKCDKCEETFHLIATYKKHCRTQHPPSQHKFTCLTCNKVFTKKANLQSHEESHVEEKQTKCSLCDKLFKGKMHLASHMYSTHSDTYSTTHKPGTMLCQFCGKSFKTRRCLLAHLRCHTGQNAFSCSICQAIFPNQSRLKRHMSTIHASKPAYECSICKKTFVYEISYQAHLNMHNNIRPFLCSTCGKGFRTSHHLKEHMNIHTQNKTFICALCNKTFLWRAQLLRHRKRSHSSAAQPTQGKPEASDKLKAVMAVTDTDGFLGQENSLGLGKGNVCGISGGRGMTEKSEPLIGQVGDHEGVAEGLVQVGADLGFQAANPAYISNYHLHEKHPQNTVVIQTLREEESASQNLKSAVISAVNVSSSNTSNNTCDQHITLVTSQSVIPQDPHNNQVGLGLAGGEGGELRVVARVPADRSLAPNVTHSLGYLTFTSDQSLPQQVLGLNEGPVMTEGSVYNVSGEQQVTATTQQLVTMDIRTVTTPHISYTSPLSGNKTMVTNSTHTYQLETDSSADIAEVQVTVSPSENLIPPGQELESTGAVSGYQAEIRPPVGYQYSTAQPVGGQVQALSSGPPPEQQEESQI